jgi:hypothetical protein
MRMNTDKSKGGRQHPRVIQGYEVRVAGHLDESAVDWLGEVSVVNRINGETTLTGSIPDQAALLRILLRLNDLSITILAVKAIYSRR